MTLLSRLMYMYGPSLATAALLVGVFTAAPANSQSCGGQTPCFETNNDMLDGKRTLLPLDDVVFMRNTTGRPQLEWQVVEMDDLQPDDYVFQGPITNVNCTPTPGAASPFQTRVGRAWPMAREFIINLTPTSAAAGDQCSTTSGNNLQFQSLVLGLNGLDSVTGFRAGALWAQIATGDVDRDGLDEILFVNGSELLVFDAAIPGDALTGEPGTPSAGFVQVGQLVLASNTTPLNEPTVADLNADGALELIWPAATPQVGATITVQIASICPFANAVLELPQGPHTCGAAFETVLSSRPIETNATITALGDQVSPGVAVTAGNFDGQPSASPGAPPDQELLFVGNQLPGNTGNVAAFAYKLDFALNAATPTSLVVHSSQSTELVVDAGPLDGGSIRDQAVIGYRQSSPASVQGVAAIDVISFDSSLAMTAFHWGAPEGQFNNIFANVAIGRFQPPNDANGALDLNQQIAMLNYAAGFNTIWVLTVDPPDFTPRLRTASGGTVIFPGGEFITGSRLQAGDIQGRSMQLGEPTVARIANHTQPSVVFGDPPKHVDYVPSVNGGTPDIINFTAQRVFFAQYDLSENSQTSSENHTLSSHSWSRTESATEKISFKVPLVSRINGAFTQTWNNTGGSTNDTVNSKYEGLAIEDTAQTDGADFISGTSQNFNLYTYPVIGQTVCPADVEHDGATLACELNSGGGCSCSADGTATACSGIPSNPSQTTCTSTGDCCNTPQTPLLVQLSGPDTVVEYTYSADATGKAEWYQPVHEPLNLLSYPWTIDQLARQVPTELIQLSTQAAFDTDTEPNELRVTWTAGGGTGSSVGSTSSHSFQTDNSITVGLPEVEKLATGAGASITGSFSYNSSTSSGSLNNKQSSLSESTGALVSKPGFSQSQVSLYSYGFEPVIFLQKPSPDVIQTVSGTCGPDGDSTCDLPVGGGGAGALQLKHTVDINNAGTWWATGPYSPGDGLPDIALNHPLRWSFTSTGSGSACVTTQGVGSTANTSVTDCVDPIPPVAQADLAAQFWSSEWHFLRGFFITVDSPDGPQRTTAIDGDNVFLGARVYNYSQKAMNSSAKVQVQFYRQAIDPQSYVTIGDSVLVGQAELDPIPPHNNTQDNPQDAPNWSLAQVSFDTTGLASQQPSHWIFWVVAWSEVAGELEQEVAFHGLDLTAPPTGEFSSLADVPPQVVSVTDASGSLVQTSFTNNYGFYHRVFSIVPPGTAAAIPPRSQAPVLRILDLRVIERAGEAGAAPLLIEADIASPGEHTGGTVVRLFEVEQGGSRARRQLVDEEILGHLDADQSYLVQVPYRPECGASQQLELVVAEGQRTEARRRTQVRIHCEPQLICHKGSKTLSLGGKAFAAHVRHGDKSGACQRGGR